jgi:BASS family bile acid:Na+ symporter
LRVILASFLFSPVLAWVLAAVVPLESPYRIGLLLLGFAPAAPFLPLAVKCARGDLSATAGLMFLASVGTVVVMPFGVPLVAPGISASAWSVARPLLLLVLLPLGAGLLVKHFWADKADWAYRYVKVVTVAGTIVFLAVTLVLNFSGFVGSLGSHALLAQLLFVSGLALGGYLISAGMPANQRSVMSLGMGTRNIGAAAAIVGINGDQKIMVMLVIATLVTVAISFTMAAWFARSGPTRLTDESPPPAAVAKAGSTS